MYDSQKKQDLQLVIVILRILAVAYFFGNLVFRIFRDTDFLLTATLIRIIAVIKRKDKTNLLLSIIVSAGLVFNFIAGNYLPESFLFETNRDLTFFGQMTNVVWVLSLYTGTFLLAFRELVIASKENGKNGRIVRIIGYILLGLSTIVATQILGFILWMTVTNYYP